MNLYVGNISPSVQHAELLNMFEAWAKYFMPSLPKRKTATMPWAMHSCMSE